MTNNKADEAFLFDRFKKTWPKFEPPSDWDVATWREILRGHSQDDLLAAYKRYRATAEYNCAPTPSEFRRCLDGLPPKSTPRPGVSRVRPKELNDLTGGLTWHEWRNTVIGSERRGSRVLAQDFAAAERRMLALLAQVVPLAEIRAADFSGTLDLAARNGVLLEFHALLDQAMDARRPWRRAA